uniref:Uncharacterized protein n=1 Tax=Rhizophora mucronata TaxID=61149 RepID=A0A2P2N5K2_RHIMU
MELLESLFSTLIQVNKFGLQNHVI